MPSRSVINGCVVHDQRSSYPGDLLDECFLRLENPSDRKVNVRSWTSGIPSPVAEEEMVAIGVLVALVKAEVKNLRSEMGGFTFVSLVGTRDWVIGYPAP
jgi:hypothetical protein